MVGMPDAMMLDSRDARRREKAARVLQEALDGRHLPGWMPGEPSGMAGAFVASELAPEVLAELGRIHHVRRWNRDAYERAVVDGALGAWRPGSAVERTAGAIRIASPVCPIAAQAEADPRACQACRALQKELAVRALGPEFEDLWFDRLITRGDAACVVTINTKRKE